MKLKIGDNIKVLSGKDKGRDGKIEKILLKKNRLIIPGINVYKKHLKGNQGVKAGIYDIPRPINPSKVIVVCPNCKKTTRIGFLKEKNVFFRVCKKCDKKI